MRDAGIVIFGDDAKVVRKKAERISAAGFDARPQSGGGVERFGTFAARTALTMLCVGAQQTMLVPYIRDYTDRTDAPFIVLDGAPTALRCELSLTLGADDYVQESTTDREVVARIRSVGRRRQLESTTRSVRRIRIGNWYYLPGESAITRHDGGYRRLDRAEARMLEYLCRSGCKPVSRTEAFRSLFGAAALDKSSERRIDQLVAGLRRKIGDRDRSKGCIKTCHGIGYALREQAVERWER